MNLVDNFNLLKNEVSQTRDIFRNRIEKGSREEELYKGTMILYSSLVYRPELLFIGINPGAGYANKYGRIYREDELEPSEGLEYLTIEDEDDYQLAKQTRELFQNSKYSDNLINSVKTNVFYTSTDSFQGMNEYYTIISNKYGFNYWEKSFEWTKKIIEMVSPKIIICEGITVIRKLQEIYHVEIEWNNDVGSCRIGNIPTIAYKRLRSNILNKIEFKEVLDTIQT